MTGNMTDKEWSHSCQQIATLLCDRYPAYVPEHELAAIADIKGPSSRVVIQMLRRMGLEIDAVKYVDPESFREGQRGWRLVGWSTPREVPMPVPPSVPFVQSESEPVAPAVPAAPAAVTDSVVTAPAPIEWHRMRTIAAALVAVGATPLRHARHGLIYRLPNGKTFLCGRRQGCPRVIQNQLAELRRRLAS